MPTTSTSSQVITEEEPARDSSGSTAYPGRSVEWQGENSGSTVYIGTGINVDNVTLSDEAQSGDLAPALSHVTSKYTENDLKLAKKTTSRHSRYTAKRISGISNDTGEKSCTLGLQPLDSIQSKFGSITEWYDIETPPIKEGSFGKIFRAKSKEHGNSGTYVAVKTIAFDSMADIQDQASFDFELRVCRQLNHPYIIKLLDSVKDDTGKCWNLVMELCKGGDLFDLIQANCGPGLFKEPVLGRFIYQMLDGIKYCHHHGFVHRDIKPENYMLLEQGMGSQLKLIDFGLAAKFEPGTVMTLRCGTTHYSAPEALRCRYTEKCDIWGIGVVFYMLCIGRWPFFDKSEAQLARVIASGPDVFGEQNKERTAEFDRASGDKVAIKALLKELLCPEADKRPSAKEVLAQNQWIAKARVLPMGRQGCCGIQ